jgi:hypothetical protein
MKLKQAEADLTLVKYIGKVYKMGDNKMVISIPKEDWKRMEPLVGKKVLVSVQEAIQE